MKTNRIKKILSVIAMGALVATALVGCGQSGDGDASKEDKDKIKIGVIQSIEHGSLDAANKGFVDGLAEAGYVDGKNITIVQQNAQGDQSNLQSIAQQFVSNHMDMIFAITTQAAQASASATTEIPIIGTAITDYVTAKLVDSNEKPGRNVSGTSDMNPIDKQVQLLKELVPDVKTIGTIYSSSEANSIEQVKELKEVLKKNNIALKEVTVSSVNDIQQAAKNLVGDGIQAIYVPTDNTIAAAMSNLVGITNDAKIPVMTGATAMVDDGGTIALGVDYYQLGKQSAEMAIKVLEKKVDIKDLPIEVSKKFDIVVNEKALEKMGIKLPESIQKELKK